MKCERDHHYQVTACMWLWVLSFYWSGTDDRPGTHVSSYGMLRAFCGTTTVYVVCHCPEQVHTTPLTDMSALYYNTEPLSSLSHQEMGKWLQFERKGKRGRESWAGSGEVLSAEQGLIPGHSLLVCSLRVWLVRWLKAPPCLDTLWLVGAWDNMRPSIPLSSPESSSRMHWKCRLRSLVPGKASSKGFFTRHELWAG